eukprot:scaffold17624_cov77-Cyclotella_meneghiniana.AAC.9
MSLAANEIIRVLDGNDHRMNSLTIDLSNWLDDDDSEQEDDVEESLHALVMLGTDRDPNHYNFMCPYSDHDGWRLIGEAIGKNQNLRNIAIQLRGHGEVTMRDTARSLELLYDNMKENTSIDSIELRLIPGFRFPVFDWSYFAPKTNLKVVKLGGMLSGLSPQNYTEIESVLTETKLKELDLLQCDFQHENELFAQIISACLSVETLAIKCEDNAEQYAALSSLLCQKSMLSQLVISYDGFVLSAIASSLAKNQKITKLTVKLSRIIKKEDRDQIRSLLCNTDSIDDIINSNHNLEEIKLFQHDEENHLPIIVKDCLSINKNRNKNKVAQKKISQYYFVDSFEMSPFVHMPYALIPKVISIIGGGWRNRHTAIFRLLKSIPNLVDALHVVQFQRTEDVSNLPRKRQKVEPMPIELWNEVSEQLDRSMIVYPKIAQSIELSYQHLGDESRDNSLYLPARSFVDKYMESIIDAMLNQDFMKIGRLERSCIEETVRVALEIIVQDLKSSVAVDRKQHSLGVLQRIFCFSRIYYRTSQSPNDMRKKMIHMFKRLNGFRFLGLYLHSRSTSELPVQQPRQQFPLSLETMLIMFDKVNDSFIIKEEDRSIQRIISGETMRVLLSADEQAIETISSDAIKRTIRIIRDIELGLGCLPLTHAYYDFSRSFALNLINFSSTELKILGWTLLELIVEEDIENPPPSAFQVKGAGLDFINGLYEINTYQITEEGFLKHGSNISYVKKIPCNGNSEDGVGKTLTLFQCTMRSQEHWWFISEADKNQPGTDRDIDYYHNKSKPHGNNLPPIENWLTCHRDSGVDPPPILQPVGVCECVTELEHNLLKWALENRVHELAIMASDDEVGVKSSSFFKFLVSCYVRSDSTYKWHSSLRSRAHTIAMNEVMSAASFLSDAESMGHQSIITYAKTRLSTAKQLAKTAHDETESNAFLFEEALQSRKKQSHAEA